MGDELQTKLDSCRNDVLGSYLDSSWLKEGILFLGLGFAADKNERRSIQLLSSLNVTELNEVNILKVERKKEKKYSVQFIVHKGSQSKKIPPKR